MTPPLIHRIHDKYLRKKIIYLSQDIKFFLVVFLPFCCINFQGTQNSFLFQNGKPQIHDHYSCNFNHPLPSISFGVELTQVIVDLTSLRFPFFQYISEFFYNMPYDFAMMTSWPQVRKNSRNMFHLIIVITLDWQCSTSTLTTLISSS